jgi:hypothetical protein
MNTAKMINGLLAIFITLPIWFYLQYKILKMIYATELMWFLFWIYLIATFVISITSKIIEGLEKK